MRSMRALAVGSAVAGLIIATPALASASAGPTSPPPKAWSTEAIAPFNLEVDGTRVLVADGAMETISSMQPDGSLATLVSGVPGAAGVATRGAWLAYTSTVTVAEGGPEGTNIQSGLNIRSPKGGTVYADTHQYEADHNPDAGVWYGPADHECMAGTQFGGHAAVVDSHAYSVASGNGGWYVADAGGNDILRVTDSGTISTVAVLPPQAVTIDQGMIEALGLDACMEGTYTFEPVPTDVEVGPDGQLYVTTLTGGSEAGFPAGQLWRIDPATGAAHLLAGGFSGATNLAIGKDGAIYIAELDGSGISVYRNGTVSPYAALPGALAVETGAGGTIWATTAGFLAGAPSQIVSISNGKVKVQAKLP
jgi:hypothetical protein